MNFLNKNILINFFLLFYVNFFNLRAALPPALAEQGTSAVEEVSKKNTGLLLLGLAGVGGCASYYSYKSGYKKALLDEKKISRDVKINFLMKKYLIG
jgi:hypothetical protein